MSDQWVDWAGVRHVVYGHRGFTVCWINATADIDREPTKPVTCLSCVAWEQRSGQRTWDLEKQGRSRP